MIIIGMLLGLVGMLIGLRPRFVVNKICAWVMVIGGLVSIALGLLPA